MAAKKVSLTTLIISILLTLFVAFILYNRLGNFSSSSDAMEQTIREQYGRELGDEVSASGQIFANGDMIDYTHTLESQAQGTIGIKSKTVNLSQYSGSILVSGKLSLARDESLVIDVRQIQQLNGSDTDTGVDAEALYISQAGLYLQEEFFQDYTLGSTIANGKISIENTTSQEALALNYFPCTTNGSDTDCGKLSKTFQQTAEKSFTTADDMIFYKQAEVNSRFTTNDSMGYFVHDAQESDVIQLAKNIRFVNEDTLNRYVMPHVSTLCSDGNARVQTVSDHSLAFRNNEYTLFITGSQSSTDQIVTCTLVIDFSRAQGAILRQLRSEQETPESETSEQEPIADDKPVVQEDLPFDPNVAQFPINKEKPFVFTSNRGHQIVFPSMNISFAGENVDTDLGFAGVRCYAQINVVSYPNKEQIQSNPSIQIFECSKVPENLSLSSQYIRTDFEDKIFITKIIDGAWVNFANNTQIVLTTQ